MENRRTVYNEGNSIDEVLPTIEEVDALKEANNASRGIVEQPVFEKKIYMTDLCTFCGNRGSELKAICRFCGTCQSCGLRSYDRNICRFCGNQQDVIEQRVKRKIVAGNYGQ